MTRRRDAKDENGYFQLLAVLFLFIISVFLCFYLRKKMGKKEQEKTSGQSVADVQHRFLDSDCARCSYSAGQMDEASLPEGNFYLGSNVLLDDIVLNTEKSIRLYLNVMTDKVFLTVLEGQVKINGYIYQKDQNRQIVIQ